MHGEEHGHEEGKKQDAPGEVIVRSFQMSDMTYGYLAVPGQAGLPVLCFVCGDMRWVVLIQQTAPASPRCATQSVHKCS